MKVMKPLFTTPSSIFHILISSWVKSGTAVCLGCVDSFVFSQTATFQGDRLIH
jgi:hypothetical protein